MSYELDPCERETLEVFLILGREVADTAFVLRASYVSAHLPIGDHGEVVAFTCEHGRVTVSGKGFEVDLSLLPEW